MKWKEIIGYGLIAVLLVVGAYWAFGGASAQETVRKAGNAAGDVVGSAVDAVGSVQRQKCNVKSPGGYYCDAAGNQTQCPAGSYYTVTLAQNANPPTPAACTKCDEGSFCERGSSGPIKCPIQYYCPDSSQKIECPAGSYCPEGSSKATPCGSGAGVYCGPRSSKEGRCPAGHSCLDNKTKEPCPAGSYCPANAREAMKCPAGMSNGPLAKDAADCKIIPGMKLLVKMTSGGPFLVESAFQIEELSGHLYNIGAAKTLDYREDTRTPVQIFGGPKEMEFQVIPGRYKVTAISGVNNGFESVFIALDNRNKTVDVKFNHIGPESAQFVNPSSPVQQTIEVGAGPDNTALRVSLQPRKWPYYAIPGTAATIELESL